MRIVLLMLAVMAVALLALPSSPVPSVASATAFAAEVPTTGPIVIDGYCQRYCQGSPGHQYCSDTPSSRNGCHHISSLGNCIFTLCGPSEPPDPEVIY